MNEVFRAKLAALKDELHHTKLLIVSKTRSEREIQDYYELGHRDFGENRVQELLEKAQHLRESCPEIRWHMIGHLQSNKVNQLFTVPNLFAIHSVDSQELLEKLIKAEHRLARPVNVFLQFNTSHEAEKSGFESTEELLKAAFQLQAANHLRPAGLMTMGTLRTENFEAEAERCFRELNELKRALEQELATKLETSMGMSQDYKIALRQHSDWIRLGTVMFTNTPINDKVQP